MLKFTFVNLNKEKYDINKEENKRLISKYFDNMFDFKEAQKNISKEDKKKLYALIEKDRNCQLYSLSFLSNKRTKGKLIMSDEIFEMLEKMFIIISDSILKKMDFIIANHLLILSQTFYKIENGEKIYLYQNIYKHEIYQKNDFWFEIIKNKIEEIIKKTEENEKHMGRVLKEKELQKRNNDILFPILITMIETMKYFRLKEETIYKIITKIFDLCDIIEDKKKDITNYIYKK